MTGWIERSWSTARAGVLLLGLSAAAGCHHKQVQPMVLPQSTPVPLATDGNANTPVLQEPAKPKLPDVPVAEAASKPKKVKKRAPKPATQTASGVTLPASVGTENAASGTPGMAGDVSAGVHPPVTEAAAAAPAANRETTVIGALSAGDEQNPKIRQEAGDLIAANERRLSSLPTEVVRRDASLVSKVRTFQRDAEQALASGDAEGARTLATKGKLLLDDLLKPST